MNTIITRFIQNREQAGKLLSEKLSLYKMESNTVIVAIPHGGVCVASSLAKALSLPLEVMPCRKIKDPSDSKKNIGSVSAESSVIHDCPYGIPQDYIYHQKILLQNEIEYEQKFYYGDIAPEQLHYKTVIVVDDILATPDTMQACLNSIKKQTPIRIIVAVAIVAAEAARIISGEVDDMVFLQIVPTINSGNEFFEDFPMVDENQVRDLLLSSKNEYQAYE